MTIGIQNNLTSIGRDNQGDIVVTEQDDDNMNSTVFSFKNSSDGGVMV